MENMFGSGREQLCISELQLQDIVVIPSKFSRHLHRKETGKDFTVALMSQEYLFISELFKNIQETRSLKDVVIPKSRALLIHESHKDPEKLT